MIESESTFGLRRQRCFESASSACRSHYLVTAAAVQDLSRFASLGDEYMTLRESAASFGRGTTAETLALVMESLFTGTASQAVVARAISSPFSSRKFMSRWFSIPRLRAEILGQPTPLIDRGAVQLRLTIALLATGTLASFYVDPNGALDGIPRAFWAQGERADVAHESCIRPDLLLAGKARLTDHGQEWLEPPRPVVLRRDQVEAQAETFTSQRDRDMARLETEIRASRIRNKEAAIGVGIALISLYSPPRELPKRIDWSLVEAHLPAGFTRQDDNRRSEGGGSDFVFASPNGQTYTSRLAAQGLVTKLRRIWRET